MISVEETVRKCRIYGMRITAQRLEILKYLIGNPIHPTAEEIYRDVKGEQPNISRATVYNTVNMLVRLGEIRELGCTSGCRRFEPDLTPHDHALCVKCGRLFDIESEGEKDTRVMVMGKPFEVKYTDITYHGLCQTCAGSDDN
ncbi:transcriptional repressor [candidate division WOR-3 bacterium]|uniref:Transcriptional repressor n=1 Tax=candidate division WOR-3 bacterium TaxID=2052148 RepID=A0A9D5K9J0_UNCW3|nr:transcriptional repressor [candidate division WOR-3 bacterium]MBD3364983.1 transcriptional repressor [candidate division WOR-3 bacterium]